MEFEVQGAEVTFAEVILCEGIGVLRGEYYL